MPKTDRAQNLPGRPAALGLLQSGKGKCLAGR